MAAPSEVAFAAILRRTARGSQDDDAHVHGVIEFCGLLADGGTRCVFVEASLCKQANNCFLPRRSPRSSVLTHNLSLHTRP
jgi:hypothetical protein